MPEIELPRIRKVSDVARALQRGRDPSTWGTSMFLVGAGCSFSAGVPLARSIVEDSVVRLAQQYSNQQQPHDDPERALAWLRENKHFDEHITWENAYGYLFEVHYPDPSEQQRIIQAAMARSRGINWFHLCLGELIAKRYVHTVLTTNFDQLVVEGVVRTGIIPVVADGIESLSRIRGAPQHPQVVHLHGSMHTYSPRNSTTAVQEPEENLGASSTLYALLHQSSALVVIGYSGGEEGIMNLLIKSARFLPDKAIYWIQYDDNPERLSPATRQLLSLSRNSGVVVGQDADEFARRMMLELGLGGPEWMLRPVQSLKGEAARIAPPGNRELASELQLYVNTLESLLRCLAREEKKRSDTQKAADAARRLRLAGDLQGALDQLRPVARDADDAEIWMMLGLSAFELGRERDMDLIREAQEAFSSALARYDRGVHPEEWATCQVALGQSLTLRGKGSKNPELLKGAVVAFRAALEVRRKEIDATAWAGVQKKLGVALRFLGQEETDSERLQESIAAFRAVLQVTDRETAPLEWADTQNSLGNALVDAGSRADGTVLLDEAAVAYRAALEVYTPGQTPDEWALLQANVGNVLTLSGQRGDDPIPLHEAVDALRQALTVQTAERVPYSWARTQHVLGTALRTLGEMQDSQDHLLGAIQAFEAALSVRRREDVAGDWAVSKSNLGNALLTLGKITGDVATMQRALDTYEEVLTVKSLQTSPVGWATTRNNIGEALFAIARITKDSELLKRAIAIYREALAVFGRTEDLAYQASTVRDNLDEAGTLLATFPPSPA